MYKTHDFPNDTPQKLRVGVIHDNYIITISHRISHHIRDAMTQSKFSPSAGAVEYTDCTSTER